MAVTIFDIAKKANVSFSTASRVLNGENYGKRSDSLRRARKILDIARAEGYQPNNAAQILAGKKSRNICLLVSDDVQSGWNNAYLNQILEGVEKTCEDLDYGLVLNNYRNDDFESFFKRRKLVGRLFDGIVITRFVTTHMSELLRQHHVPFVSINRHFENKDNIPAYYTIGSGTDIIDYAYQRGHRKIGFIHYDKYPDIEHLRRHVKDNNLADCKVIPLSLSVPSDLSSAPEVMARYFELPADERPTLIAGNYQTTAILIKEMHKYGLSCPDDISLISNCDSEMCMVVSPELTVITPDNRRIGENAARKLIDFLENKQEIGYDHCPFGNILIERESVRTLSPQ